ncbi:MAG: hypothetical protein GF364_10455 [Candidatus Lokiarchaeota archaeon]|nr:hypothetical protein [Candidatus Lokiarchaeota archaeon]
MPLEDVDLEKLTRKWRNEKLSGASIKAICQEAAMNAIRETTAEGPRKGIMSVTMNDFVTGFKRYKHKLRGSEKTAPVYS